MSVFVSNLQAVRRRVAKAAQGAGRTPESVCLIAVSKTFQADAVGALLAAGQRDFGENYLQEAEPKMALANAFARQRGLPAPVWHMIGPLQSNKTRAVAEHFDWVHTVDRLKIAERLSAQRPDTMAALKVCIQINISREATKSGIAVDAFPELARAVFELPRIELMGLMTIPAQDDGGAFARLRALLDRPEVQHLHLKDLSMGMSDDLEAAVAAGATLVRVGTAIFGPRRPASAIGSAGAVSINQTL